MTVFQFHHLRNKKKIARCLCSSARRPRSQTIPHSLPTMSKSSFLTFCFLFFFSIVRRRRNVIDFARRPAFTNCVSLPYTSKIRDFFFMCKYMFTLRDTVSARYLFPLPNGMRTQLGPSFFFFFFFLWLVRFRPSSKNVCDLCEVLSRSSCCS